MTELDFASLLASHLCHDVIGPVGAIQNGLEMIAEDKSMTAMAMDLIVKSATKATAKLEYARMALGAAGGAETLDPGKAGRITAGMFHGERATLAWEWTGDAGPRVAVKLAMLLATFAQGAVPLGGKITVTYSDGAGPRVVAEGAQLRTPPFLEIATGGGEVADPRAVQPLFIERLAASAGWHVQADVTGTTMTFRMVPAA